VEPALILRSLFAHPLIGHGITHKSRLVASWTSANAGYTDRAWIFSLDVRAGGQLGKAFGLFGLLAAMGLISAGFGIRTGGGWWTALAVGGAVATLIVLISWWKATLRVHRCGALFW
jgi:hypothetical protein